MFQSTSSPMLTPTRSAHDAPKSNKKVKTINVAVEITTDTPTIQKYTKVTKNNTESKNNKGSN